MNRPLKDLAREPITTVLAVVVLYKLSVQDSPTLRTLLAAAHAVPSLTLKLGILIQDNTPGGQEPGDLPEGARYEAAPGNPGLAHAYNRALEIAGAENFDWLLTLDQDTVLPRDYLDRMVELAGRFQSSAAISAIVPQIAGDGRNISPFRFAAGAVPRWFRYGFTGVPTSATYALNSAALLRVSALTEIGGYDPLFPLDVSDINLFHRLAAAGKQVYIAGDILVRHEFSLFKKNQRMSIERYQAMLLDECAFWDRNMGLAARLERMVRLAGRACKDSLDTNHAAFRNAAMRELTRRLLTSKARRMAEWTTWANARLGASEGSRSVNDRCKVGMKAAGVEYSQARR